MKKAEIEKINVIYGILVDPEKKLICLTKNGQILPSSIRCFPKCSLHTYSIDLFLSKDCIITVNNEKRPFSFDLSPTNPDFNILYNYQSHSSYQYNNQINDQINDQFSNQKDLNNNKIINNNNFEEIKLFNVEAAGVEKLNNEEEIYPPIIQFEKTTFQKLVTQDGRVGIAYPVPKAETMRLELGPSYYQTEFFNIVPPEDLYSPLDIHRNIATQYAIMHRIQIKFLFQIL